MMNAEIIDKQHETTVKDLVILISVVVFIGAFLLFISQVGKGKKIEDSSWYLVTNEAAFPYLDDKEKCDYFASEIRKNAKSEVTSKCMTGKEIKAQYPTLANASK